MMSHKDVYKTFINIFNIGKIEQWWQNGFNSIRIRFDNKKEVVFTYYNNTSWKLETIDQFIETMNKRGE